MQTIKIICAIILLIWLPYRLRAQSVNWGNLNGDKPHYLHVQAGIEHGAVFGLGYSHWWQTGPIGILGQIEFSTPSGEVLLDDFKTKLGGQINWWHSGSWYFSTKLQGIFRRYQSDIVRLVNFGSDLGATLGYFRPKWLFAAEVGFDKSIVSHFKHEDVYYTIHPEVVDGWYEPSTGGNFYYGLQTGISFSSIDLIIKAGKIISQDFRSQPLLPLYGQLGINIKL